jgi:hypothetical protein
LQRFGVLFAITASIDHFVKIMPTSADRLLSQESQVYNKLYDPEAMLSVSGSVAHGYVILLSGGAAGGGAGSTSPSLSSSSKDDKKKKKVKKKKKGSSQDDDVSLAFMALTSGNVLDACFGVKSGNSGRNATPASRAAADAKSLLGECDANIVDDDETFRRTAVHAYCDAFKVVVVHADKMKKLNCFTRCFLTKKIRTTSQEDLQESFGQLAQIINEQSN